VNPSAATPYLFSIDLEDVRQMIPEGERFPPRVEENTLSFLDFLKRHGAYCTFFVVGDVMRSYPELVKRIVDEGHELACHTDRHIPLDKLGPDGFRKDLENWLETAERFGLPRATGFRAPTFSLTGQTPWAHGVLKEFGFGYSSSVLPARNPLFGWPGFGQHARHMDGILEIPMNLASLAPMQVPFGGGVYFRVLPWFLVRHFFLRGKSMGQVILGYFHPYDVDTAQERFMHPGINGSRIMNFLMYVGRDRVLTRLDRVMKMGFKVVRYDMFAGEWNRSMSVI
jgi:polysaccharide deacetylase family protein (PEP-CTERM system associated)